MLEIFIVKSSSYGSNQLRKTLKRIGAEHIEHNVAKSITYNQIVEMLKRTELGFGDLLSKRSRPYKEIKHKMDDMRVNELIAYIIENPRILHLPILLDVDKDRMAIGYNPYTIKPFIPKEKRALLQLEP